MLLQIVQAGHPVLRERARDLTPDEIRSAATEQLIALMRETMRDAPGVGLAAPQVGVALRLAVIEDAADVHPDVRAARAREPVPFHVIVNPVLHLWPDDDVVSTEGCLSVRGYVANVARARRVRVECLDERGAPRVIDASGWYARILQHEIDHLDGTLYVDRMDTRTFADTRQTLPVPTGASAR
jgi:peptide deformylase